MNITFATCSFSEYRAEMGGVPVCIANGAPRYKLRYPPYAGKLLVTLPELFPQWNLVQAAKKGLDFDNFSRRYRAGLHKIGTERIMIAAEDAHRNATQQAREFGRDIDDNEPLVLLCHEKMGKSPDEYCHRRSWSHFLAKHVTGEELPEWGSVWTPETAGAQVEQEGLF